MTKCVFWAVLLVIGGAGAAYCLGVNLSDVRQAIVGTHVPNPVRVVLDHAMPLR